MISLCLACKAPLKSAKRLISAIQLLAVNLNRGTQSSHSFNKNKIQTIPTILYHAIFQNDLSSHLSNQA